MGEIERSRSLSQSELAAVLRRAAELDSEATLPVPADGLDPLVVEAAAIEAGLSPHAVRQALREVMHPDGRAPDLYDQGRLLPARQLVMAREVPGTAGEVEERIGRFMRRQLFSQKRLFADGSVWEPRSGWAANFRRGIDPGGRLVLGQVKKVAVSVTEAEPGESQGDDDASVPRVVVRITLDLSSVRSIHTAWLAGGAVSGAGVIGVTGMVVGIDPVALASLPVAGGLAAGGHFVGRRSAQYALEQIHTGVAGLLDRLEHPDRDRADRGVRALGRRTGGAGRKQSRGDK